MIPPLTDDIHDQVVEAFVDGDQARLVARLEDEWAGELPAMLHAAWLMGANAVRNAVQGRRICRICGCWEDEACVSGCWWVGEDLCSTCAPQRQRPDPTLAEPLPPMPSRDAAPPAKFPIRIPLFWRLAAYAIAIFGFGQLGFAAFNSASWFAWPVGVTCILLAVWLFGGAVSTLIKDIK